MPEIPELIAPRVVVTLDDGTSWAVQTGNPDLVAWDLTSVKHKWPPLQSAPFLWLSFIAWHASRRKKLLPEGMSWEVFRVRAESIDAPDLGVDPHTDATSATDPLGPGWDVAAPFPQDPESG